MQLCNRVVAKIIGTGCYLPKTVLSNEDLEKMVHTSNEWIVSRTGMRERRLAGADESSSDLGYKAAQIALEMSGISPKELQLIICATITPDYLFPSTACLIQSRLGATQAASFDLQAACSGYLYGLSIAKAFIESSSYDPILLVVPEKLSSIVDYTDRNTCVLFGDGAAACIISSNTKKETKGLIIKTVSLGSDGNQAELLMLPAGGSRQPASHETVDQKKHFIKMDGKETYKHAIRCMETACQEVLQQSDISEEQISFFIPHQANMRIIESLAKRFRVPKERVYLTIHKYGNTSASSIGIALHELTQESVLQAGDHLLLTAFGSGLTWGASVLQHEG